MRRIGWPAVAAVVAMFVAACGDGGPGVEAEGAWARTSPEMADAAAVYMQLRSTDADRLVGASVDASVADRVEIHETVMAQVESDEAPEETMAEGMGAMTMQEIGEIDLPAGEAVDLEPGGLHVMLLGLTEPLQSGDTFDVTLRFETAGDLAVEVEVRDEAP